MLDDGGPNLKLTRRLRKLSLLEDRNTFHELDARSLPPAVQDSLVGAGGARAAIRHWINVSSGSRECTATEFLIALEQMRSDPASAASLLREHLRESWGPSLARCSIGAARSLFDLGRGDYADARIDSAVNFMLEAQQEFLFALATGELDHRETQEALGKYAVAVAFSSRWRRTDTLTLERAIRFQRRSIALGNTDPEAHIYLSDLYSELFDTTGDGAHLNSAVEALMVIDGTYSIGAIESAYLAWLKLSELHLKRSIFRSEEGLAGASDDLNAARRLVSQVRPRTGVEYVQRDFVDKFTLDAYLRSVPLGSRQIRFPYGFLTELANVDDTAFVRLREIVVDALVAMQERLEKRAQPPNIVAQRVLLGVLRASASRDSRHAMSDASHAARIAREASTRTQNRYFEFVHADALLSLASLSSDRNSLNNALAAFERIIEEYPDWSMPRVGLARGMTLARELHHEGIRDFDDARAWRDAVRSIVVDPAFRRTDLGGRSSVFAIEDAEGDLASTLIFKPTVQRENAQREAALLRVLGDEVAGSTSSGRFLVPRSLSIVSVSTKQHFHVIERQSGVLLSNFERSVAAQHLDDCVELLAMFHNAVGLDQGNRSAWRKVKNGLKLCSRTLFETNEQADEFVSSMRTGFPSDLPLVRKRDAHASNWSVDVTGRVVAFDLESASYLPVGHDVAQLVEDYALLTVDDEAFSIRLELLSRYLSFLNFEVDKNRVYEAHEWYVLLRAVWIASSSSASKAQHAHARQLVQHLADRSNRPEIVEPTQALMRVFRQPLHVNTGELDARHRRSSKNLSRILRHRAVEMGLEMDREGYVRIQQLAETTNVSADEILAIANHPAEPRFEVDGDRIRALYGHSIRVPEPHSRKAEAPEVLYHGTSWNALDEIAYDGLKPMGRNKVHMTVSPSEAIEVARRHQRPVLLALDTTGIESLQSVADAVWTADEVLPAMIKIVNPFTVAPSPPAWLTETMSM